MAEVLLNGDDGHTVIIEQAGIGAPVVMRLDLYHLAIDGERVGSEDVLTSPAPTVALDSVSDHPGRGQRIPPPQISRCSENTP